MEKNWLGGAKMDIREKLIELLHNGVRCPGTVDGWGVLAAVIAGGREKR